MSTAKTTNKNVSVTKQNKAPAWVWLFALVPVLSAVLFYFILADMIPFIKFEIFYTDANGELAWHTSSILVLLLTMAGWGACGFVYGFFRAKMWPAIITAHALPILSVAVYTFCVLGVIFGGDAGLADVSLFAALGMGLFNYIDTFIYGFLSIGNFGVYIELIFMVFIFIAGYTIGKSKRLKA